MPATPRLIAVALGSNLGDRAAHLAFATSRLRGVLADLVVSQTIETNPEGNVAQPLFLNAAAVGTSAELPATLLAAFMSIERDAGRERAFPGAPRTLDLDLILAGDLVVTEAALTVPHPRFRGRRFVLEPLAAIAPDLVDPVTTRTVQELLDGVAVRTGH